MKLLGLLLLVPSLAFGQVVTFTGTAPSFAASAPSGSVGYGLLQGARLSLNYPTNTAYVSYNGTDYIVTLPASKGWKWNNGSDRMVLTSAGALTVTSVTTGNTGVIVGSAQYGHVFFTSASNALGGSPGYDIRADTTDSAGNLGIKLRAGKFNNGGAMTAADLVAIFNDTTQVVTFNYAGGIKLNVGSAAKPTCNSGLRGTIHYTPSGAGVADVIQVCSKSSGDAYAWRDLATPES